MTYVLALLLVALAVQHWLYRRDLMAQRQDLELQLRNEREGSRKREDQLLNRIQAPERAVVMSIEPDDRKHYISEGDEDRRFEEALADG